MTENTFETRLLELKHYKELFGNVNVPYNYVTEDGSKLGYFVSNIRCHPDRCSNEQVAILTELGFEWEIGWPKQYRIIKEYSKENDINKLDYSIYYKDYPVGIWVQRLKQKKHKGELAEEQRVALENLGIQWDSYAIIYNKMELLRLYYNDFGTIATIKTRTIYRGKNIGGYIFRFRRKYRNHKLTNDIIQELESMGMVWEPVKKYFCSFVELAYLYLNEGNVIKSHTEYQGYSLGSWYYKQLRDLKKGLLPEERANSIIKLMNINSNNMGRENINKEV